MSLTPEQQADILRSIALQGAATQDNAQQVQLVVGSRENLNHIVDTSSGRPRIRTNVIKKFALILTQPSALAELNPFEIRCVLCKSVISYPAWYYSVRYAVNHFHYFVCFDASSPLRVTAKCYKK